MLDIKQILKTFNKELIKLFNVKVYGNDTKGGYKLPCFHTELIVNESKRVNKHIYKTDITINAAYLMETVDEVKQYEVIKFMRDNFSNYLKVENRTLHIERLETGYSGENKDTLDFSIDITFYENTYIKTLDDPITDVYFRVKKKEETHD